MSIARTLAIGAFACTFLAGCGETEREPGQLVSPLANFEINLAESWLYDGVTEETPPLQWLRIWFKSNSRKADFSARGRLIGGVMPDAVASLADLERVVPRSRLREFSEYAMRHAMSLTNDEYRRTLFENGAVGYAAGRAHPGQTEATYICMMFKGREYLVAYLMVPAAYTPRSAEIIQSLTNSIRVASANKAAGAQASP